MYCKHCGREIDDNSSFCKYFGKAQDNRVSASNGFIDFITKKPILSSYILWVIINTVCLCSGNKCGEFYYMLYPRYHSALYDEYLDYNCFSLNYYQITDFVVYAILIPLVLYLGYHYFKKVTSIKYRILWALWFIFHIAMYKMSNFEILDAFFPFTNTVRYDTFSFNATHYMYPYFSYHAYDLTELVFYTMIIPIAIWGYKYYKDRKKETKNIK